MASKFLQLHRYGPIDEGLSAVVDTTNYRVRGNSCSCRCSLDWIQKWSGEIFYSFINLKIINVLHFYVVCHIQHLANLLNKQKNTQTSKLRFKAHVPNLNVHNFHLPIWIETNTDIDDDDDVPRWISNVRTHKFCLYSGVCWFINNEHPSFLGQQKYLWHWKITQFN